MSETLWLLALELGDRLDLARIDRLPLLLAD
jgi:hypothetical protein